VIKNNFRQIILFLPILFVTLAVTVASLAAPIPLTSSSLFISSKKGLFRSPLGFSIDLANTEWVQIPTPKNNTYIETVYRASDDSGSQAALTVRIDSSEKKVDLSEYAQKWLKDYPRFGFDVITSKKVRVGNEIAFLLDLVGRDNAKQLRQVLFAKGKNVVTLTCRDDIKTFSKSLKSCNEIIRSLRW
jgi:hypothetical protein